MQQYPYIKKPIVDNSSQIINTCSKCMNGQSTIEEIAYLCNINSSQLHEEIKKYKDSISLFIN